jgi:tetratricopeptide (TPR) repeat protein
MMSTTDPQVAVYVVTLDHAQGQALLTALAGQGLPARVVSAEREVLAGLDRLPAMVLIIDAQLALMSGFELAREVRRQAGAGQVGLIVLSDVNWNPAQKAAAIHQMSLAELLVKPVDTTQLALKAAQAYGALQGLASNRRSLQPLADDPDEPSAVYYADSASHREKQQVEQAAMALQAQQDDLRGNLTMIPFPALLHQLYCRRATGALFLLRDTIKKIVYLHDGHPFYIKSNLLSECLGKILVREGLITESQCKESLQRMKESRRQQGTVLIEMGVISPHNLVVGLQLQLHTKLMDIFSWSRGEYLFKVEIKMPAEVIRLDLSNATLIADGVRNCWTPERITEALSPHLDRHLVPSAEPAVRFQELNLAEDEQYFLDSVDGVRTLRELLASSSLPSVKARTIAYILLATGVVEASARPADEEEPGPLIKISSAPEESQRKRLAAQLISLQQRDAYGVLGVSTEAADLMIEQAYATLAREYHPDRFRNASREVRQLADEIFSLIYQAYRQISTTELRRSYELQYGMVDTNDTSQSGSRSLSAERLNQEAQQLFAIGKWTEAASALGHALSLCPEAGDLRASYAWALFQTDPLNATVAHQAIGELRRAIELDPEHDRAYLSLGRIYLALGKSILAERQFEKAVQCNPDCSEALEELRQQKLRRAPRRRSKLF